MFIEAVFFLPFFFFFFFLLGGGSGDQVHVDIWARESGRRFKTCNFWLSVKSI